MNSTPENTDRQRKAKRKSTHHRICTYEGCTHIAKLHGLCISHGGGIRCKVSKCTSGAKQGGFCVKHGGGKRCLIPECTEAAQTRPLCRFHGGRYRCKSPECIILPEANGLCTKHGKRAYLEFLAREKEKASNSSGDVSTEKSRVAGESTPVRGHAIRKIPTSQHEKQSEPEVVSSERQMLDIEIHAPADASVSRRHQTYNHPRLKLEIWPCKSFGCLRIARETGFCANHEQMYE